MGRGREEDIVDGDRERPTINGTGTEDDIGTAWGQGEFDHSIQGSQVADKRQGHFNFYRFYLHDPVVFHEEAKVTMQQIGTGEYEKVRQTSGEPVYRAGKNAGPEFEEATEIGGLFERQDRWASCAYFALDRPTNDLPPLAPVEERIKDMSSESPSTWGPE